MRTSTVRGEQRERERKKDLHLQSPPPPLSSKQTKHSIIRVKKKN